MKDYHKENERLKKEKEELEKLIAEKELENKKKDELLKQMYPELRDKR